jgi:hypothetical protein
MDFAWKYVDSFDTACANYIPYFDVPPVDHETLLDCGSLVLTSGVLGDYHIEWKLDSPTQSATTVFTSGITTDLGEVQIQHPFSSPQPVFAGTLYPVFKYLYVDGIKFSAYQDELGAQYSPDLLVCLGPYIVDSLNCLSTLGADSVYPYYLTYNNTSDFGATKSRTLKFDLLSETPYLAWEFQCETVADRLDIYYCTEANPWGTLVDSFINGAQSSPGVYLFNDLEPVGYPGIRGAVIPRVTNNTNSEFGPLLFVSKFTDFTWASGDYLLIEITGSVLEPTVTNTDWYIKLKCIYDIDLECSLTYDDSCSKLIDTPYMVYEGDPTCAYKVYYNTLTVPTNPSRSSSSTPFLQKYLKFVVALGSSASGVISTSFFSSNPIYIGLSYLTTATTLNLSAPAGFQICMNLDLGETVLVEYNAGDIIYTFSDVDDYDKYKADYAAIQANANYITWSGLTDADPRYYAHLRIYHHTATSCGDDLVQRVFYIWIGSTFVFDDVNQKMTITCTVPTNALIDTDCNNLYDTINNHITWFERARDNSYALYAIPVGGLLSSVRTVSIGYFIWTYGIDYSTSSAYRYSFSRIHQVMLNGLCDLSVHGFCLIGGYWTIFRQYDRLTLTDPTDHASRLANWRLERMIGLRTDDCNDFDDPADFEIVYETP